MFIFPSRSPFRVQLIQQSFLIWKPNRSSINPFDSIFELIRGCHSLCDANKQQVEYIIRRKVFDSLKFRAALRYDKMEFSINGFDVRRSVVRRR